MKKLQQLSSCGFLLKNTKGPIQVHIFVPEKRLPLWKMTDDSDIVTSSRKHLHQLLKATQVSFFNNTRHYQEHPLSRKRGRTNGEQDIETFFTVEMEEIQCTFQSFGCTCWQTNSFTLKVSLSCALARSCF